MIQWARALRIALVILVLAFVCGLFGWLGYYYVYHAELTAHESYVSLAAHEAMTGRVPCLDFAYSRMPLLLYLDGVLMTLTGYGLTPQRLINVAVAALGLLAIVLAVRSRLGSFEPGLVAAFTAAASPQWVWIQARGTSYAWAGLFLAIGFLAAMARWSPRRRAVVFAIAAALALHSDPNTLLVTIILAAVLVLQLQGIKERLIAIGTYFGVLILAFVPMMAVVGAEVYYFNWVFPFSSALTRHVMVLAVEWWQVSPGVILILLIGLLGVPILVKKRRLTELLLLAAGFVGIVVAVLPEHAYGHFIAPAVPLAAAAGIMALWATGSAGDNPFRHVFWLLPAIALLYPLPRVVEHDVNDELDEIVEVLKGSVPQGPVLTPVPLIAVMADREVIPGTEQGMYSAMAPEDHRIARRLRLVTIPGLTKIVSKKTPAAIVRMTGRSNWNFRWQVPSMLRQPKKAERAFTKAIRKHYRRIHRTRSMEILVRKDP
ncbi:MAG: hypothetical protein GY854_05015 [Deltaproteobacteria bacterium]|nr:hypothetical protein [Deltaproteobacteria bacterium]